MSPNSATNPSPTDPAITTVDVDFPSTDPGGTPPSDGAMPSEHVNGSAPTAPSGHGRRHRAVVVAILTAAALVVAAGASYLLREPTPLPGIAREPALTTTGIELVDYGSRDDGVTAGLAAVPGGVNLAYFGYLSCPDVCPTTMADIRASLQDLPAEIQERVAVTFVSVDPERDDPDAMRDYMGHFFVPPTTIRVMRADGGTTLDQATAQLGVIHEVEAHAPGTQDYDVSHSAITYVIDDNGNVVRELPFGTPPEDFTTIINAIVD